MTVFSAYYFQCCWLEETVKCLLQNLWNVVMAFNESGLGIARRTLWAVPPIYFRKNSTKNLCPTLRMPVSDTGPTRLT